MGMWYLVTLSCWVDEGDKHTCQNLSCESVPSLLKCRAFWNVSQHPSFVGLDNRYMVVYVFKKGNNNRRTF
jgi:hypothetical protein